MNDKVALIEYCHGSSLPDSVEAFLRELGKPALIKVSGHSADSCRLVVTLQHGNEPSGTIGCYRFLKEKVVGEKYTPETDVYFFIAGVDLALTEPPFSVRQYPGSRDLNRCYFEPSGDRPGEIAAELLFCLEALKPEAVLDIHNTSGDGPSFSVCSELTRDHLALTALFTHRIVITDLGLGALIDLTRPELPIVTIECGGVASESSHQTAYEGIQQLAASKNLFTTQPGEDFDIYHHPVRLELTPGTQLDFADDRNPDSDITLPRHIDKRNFGVITPDIPLGWVNSPDCLRVRAASGYIDFEEYFLIRNGRLYSAHPLKLFMVTTRPEIALSDCLLYAVKEMDHRHLLE